MKKRRSGRAKRNGAVWRLATEVRNRNALDAKMGVCQFEHTPIFIQQRAGYRATNVLVADRIRRYRTSCLGDEVSAKRNPDANSPIRLRTVCLAYRSWRPFCPLHLVCAFLIVGEETTRGQFVEFVHVLP